MSKRFGSLYAVNNSSLAIHKGEIISFLGPSGCGKSTLLNMIAGFIQPDAGDIRLAGRSIVDLPPNKRETGMVFQHYALFPHMTVKANIAYGLEARGQPAALIKERVSTMLSLLKLDSFGDRYPAELSGGQRQRVAVARALAPRPKVLLLDEALSALDKNLREEMQIELSLLLRQLQITTIMVTHDQAEAFAVSDRIAIMEQGHIVQVGTPEDVYRNPASSFVLRFLGSANEIPALLQAAGSSSLDAVAPTGLYVTGAQGGGKAGDATAIFLRSEDIRLSAQPTELHRSNPGRITLVTFLGSISRFVIDLSGIQIVADYPTDFRSLAVGDAVYLDVAPGNIRVMQTGAAG
ncbi:ABC transporter ATP-binding protein [Aureimonas fodinaquatilis]|uniref:ABC transporter ATP-binding protein n=1 Tax=Aureimonas fodinaquatilis TaxID=2565783 RepID=UPI00165E2B26|nr:ABC transporter ATP-binding protein [Aureimonas fodinaquatilis]